MQSNFLTKFVPDDRVRERNSALRMCYQRTGTHRGFIALTAAGRFHVFLDYQPFTIFVPSKSLVDCRY